MRPLNWTGGVLLLILVPLAGCQPAIDPQDLGKIIEDPDKLPGYNQPYPLPELDAMATQPSSPQPSPLAGPSLPESTQEPPEAELPTAEAPTAEAPSRGTPPSESSDSAPDAASSEPAPPPESPPSETDATPEAAPE